MDDWDWSYGDWGSSYDWSTPSWGVPSYDWSAPSYEWSSPSYNDVTFYDWSSPEAPNYGDWSYSDWSAPSYDAGYWSDYLPSYESSYDWSTPSYNEFYTPASYSDFGGDTTWSDIQPTSYDVSYDDYSNMDSALRNIDLAEGVGQLDPYQAEEARLGVQQDTARSDALARLQQQADEELGSLTSDSYRQDQIAQMQQQAAQEQAAVQADLARQERIDQMRQQAGQEQNSVLKQIAAQGLGTLSDVINPKESASTSSTAAKMLSDLAKTLGTTGLKQAQAAAKYQASPIAGIANTTQSVLQILKALKGQNLTPTQARSSTVQSTGPRMQAARPVRTLYAKGGAIELPTEVMGGLLPLTLKIAEHMLGGGQGRHEGLIPGEEGGQDDVVDIKAAPGEYIIDAEIVSALGDGNNENGARKLDEMRYNIRKHKRTGGLAQIAPKAKNVKEYMKG